MLQNRQQDKRTKIELPPQVKAPDFRQIEYLLDQSQANLGRPIELPFGTAPTTYALCVLRHRPKDEAQWMCYKFENGKSSLEWSYSTSDPSMIHNAMAAAFPDVALNVKTNDKTFKPAIMLRPADDEEAQPAGRSAPAPKPRNALMEGQLQHLQIANLLQSISMSKMTGRLEFENERDRAELFFTEGVITHCKMTGIEGEAAVLELVGWDSGKYRFYQEPPYDKQTVRRRMDLLLMEGATLLDQWTRMRQMGLKLESYVFRLHQTLTEQSFEQIVAHGSPSDLNLLKSLYQAIDGHSSLAELIRRCPIAKRDWVPAVYTLVGCQLIGFRDTPPPVAQKHPLETHIPPAQVDWAQVRQAERSLIRTDTGLFSYYAILGFLEREHLRFEAFRRPYSLVVLEVSARNNTNQLEALSLKGMREAAEIIERVKRKCDIIGHFETFGIALILPETSSASARHFVRMLSETLVGSEPVDGGKRLVVNVGVATVPEDCDRLESSLTLANPRLRPA